MVYEIATALKNLNSDDLRSCHVILVLGDADAAFGLPKDSARQTLVWVDDFTIDQASRFFDNLRCLPLAARIDGNGTDLNLQLRRRVFEHIGTRPADLESVANALARLTVGSALDQRVDELIDAQLADATDVLRDLFEQSASPNGAEFRVARSLPRGGARAARWRRGDSEKGDQGAGRVSRSDLSHSERNLSFSFGGFCACGAAFD